jgi:hypothetical protein
MFGVNEPSAINFCVKTGTEKSNKQNRVVSSRIILFGEGLEFQNIITVGRNKKDFLGLMKLKFSGCGVSMKPKEKHEDDLAVFTVL